jgi:cytochrome c oxidase assembly protein subunit 15
MVVPWLIVGRDASTNASVVVATGRFRAPGAWGAGAAVVVARAIVVEGAPATGCAVVVEVTAAVAGTRAVELDVVSGAAVPGGVVPASVPTGAGSVGTGAVAPGAADGAGSVPGPVAVVAGPAAHEDAATESAASAAVTSPKVRARVRPGRGGDIAAVSRGRSGRPSRACRPGCRRTGSHRYCGDVRVPRLSPRAYERITLFALFALGFIIVTGAAVRLSNSGLGCTQWPNCTSDHFVATFDFNQWMEFGNRLVTGLVSVAVIVAALGAVLRVPRRRDLIWWSLGLVASIPAQAVLGGISVLMDLAPPFITAHFLLSIIILWNAVVLHRLAGQPEGPPIAIVDREGVRSGRLLVTLAVLVLLTGTLVTGTGPNAGDPKAARYTFLSLTDISRIHSATAWLFLLAALAVLWRFAKAGVPAQVDQRGRRLVGAIVAQGAIGYAQYVTGLPGYLVLFHIVGAVLVFVAALDFHLGLFTRASGPDSPGSPDAGQAGASTADGPREGMVIS